MVVSVHLRGSSERELQSRVGFPNVVHFNSLQLRGLGYFTLFGILLPTTKTKSVYFLGLMNSATKDLRRV